MSAAPGISLFQEEARELLAGLDTALLDLDPGAGGQPTPDREDLNHVFRILHTLKGSSDMFGMENAVAMLHGIESLWDQVRSSGSPPGTGLISLTLALKDALSPLGDHGEDPLLDTSLLDRMAVLADLPEAEPDASPDTGPVIGADAGAGEDTARAASNPEAAPEGGACQVRNYSITYAPTDPGHLAKLEPAGILDSLRAMGRAEILLDPTAVPDLEDLDVRDCHLKWSVTLATDQDKDAVRDVFLFLDNPADATVEELLPGAAPCTSAVPVQTAQTAQTAPSEDIPQAARAPQPDTAAPAAQISPPAQASPAKTPPPAKAAPTVPAASQDEHAAVSAPAPPPPGKPKPPAQSVRVETSKLDNLVNLVGELVIAQARLTQMAGKHAIQELSGVAEEIERLVVELRDNTLGIRMLPIGTTFSRYRRLVRDLASELGKEIELTAEGGETELDKTVIEQLSDPLVHLIRNSIDHGIEPPGERESLGKPRRGHIMLTARQASGSVEIRIEDDGRGLDPARIRSKAVERGIIPADARLSTQDIFQLIFAPGFSTAEKVTNISGRGVGMDVVKSSIESLRGTVALESSPGKGTTVFIQLPLTLAIIDGLQVRVEEELYIIPLSMVEECVELATARASTSEHNRTLSVRGEIVPFIRLRETFLTPGAPPALEQVVVTRHEHGRTGIAVDEVVGQQQTVIKNLGRLIGRIDGISGATINGDGTMALILDVPQLVASMQREGSSWETL